MVSDLIDKVEDVERRIGDLDKQMHKAMRECENQIDYLRKMLKSIHKYTYEREQEWKRKR